MPRFHTTQDGLIQFTDEEEAAWDFMEAAYVPPNQTPAPTKEQLMLELQTLTAKINALSEPVSLLDKVSTLLGVK